MPRSATASQVFFAATFMVFVAFIGAAGLMAWASLNGIVVWF